MARIDPQHLAWCLESLAEGQIVNQIKVPEEDAKQAKNSIKSNVGMHLISRILSILLIFFRFYRRQKADEVVIAVKEEGFSR